MNRIVREHYPVAKLPSDLRGAFESGDQVTVTVEPETAPEPDMSLDDVYAIADGSHLSKAEIDAFIETTRNEWER